MILAVLPAVLVTTRGGSLHACITHAFQASRPHAGVAHTQRRGVLLCAAHPHSVNPSTSPLCRTGPNLPCHSPILAAPCLELKDPRAACMSMQLSQREFVHDTRAATSGAQQSCAWSCQIRHSAQTPAAASTSCAAMTSTSAPSLSLTMTPREACTFSGRTPSSRSTSSYLGLRRQVTEQQSKPRNQHPRMCDAGGPASACSLLPGRSLPSPLAPRRLYHA